MINYHDEGTPVDQHQLAKDEETMREHFAPIDALKDAADYHRQLIETRRTMESIVRLCNAEIRTIDDLISR